MRILAKNRLHLSARFSLMALVGLALAYGAATGEGLMTLSKDGRYLTATEYDADVGKANITTSASSTISQVIAPLATPTASCTPSWVVVNSPNVGTNTNNLSAIAGSGNDVWAVGHYYTGPNNGNIWKTLTLHWDGSAWSIVPSPNFGANSNFLYGVSGSGNDVWAVGYYYTFNGGWTVTLHWDGGAWSAVPSPNAGGASGLNAVSGSGNDVWAVGTYSDGSAARTLTLHWDGSTWSQVPSPNVGAESNQLYAVTGSGNDVWAVGYYTFFGQTLTLHWNGSSWSVVPSPNPGTVDNQLFGVSGSGNDVWAVGFYSGFDDVYHTMTLHWNGSAWSWVPSPDGDAGQNQLGAVSGSGNDVWAVGSVMFGATVTLHWDGSAWSLVPSPDVGTGSNQLHGVIGGGNDVWAVGEYSTTGGNQTLTLHWTSPCTPTPTSAASRKGHGAAGTFDVPLPLTGSEGRECRSGGATNDYQMIVNFANTVTVESVAVTSGRGSVSSFSVSGSQVTVNLTGVTNVQRITVTLHNVNDGTSTGDVPVSMGVLVGDVNGNAVVNASDVSLTKSQVGVAVGGSNFREDVNANGVINSVDVAQVKANVGTSLPP